MNHPTDDVRGPDGPSAGRDRSGWRALLVGVHVTEATVRLTLAGEFDVSEVPAFERTVVDALEPSHGTLVVDAASLTFIGAGGIQALVWAEQLASEHGAAFQLTGISPFLGRLLRIVGLQRWGGGGPCTSRSRPTPPG